MTNTTQYVDVAAKLAKSKRWVIKGATPQQPRPQHPPSSPSATPQQPMSNPSVIPQQPLSYPSAARRRLSLISYPLSWFMCSSHPPCPNLPPNTHTPMCPHAMHPDVPPSTRIIPCNPPPLVKKLPMPCKPTMCPAVHAYNYYPSLQVLPLYMHITITPPFRCYLAPHRRLQKSSLRLLYIKAACCRLDC